MTAPRKLLILGGLGLAAWGMAYGIFYAVFIEHQTLDGLGGALASGFMRAAERRMTESQAALADAASRSFVYVRQVDAHGHWIGLGLLLVILGIAFDRVGFQERGRLFLALMLLAGSALFPLGVLLETWNRGLGPQAIAVVGSALVILGLFGTAWGFARGD
jgi:dipeptide/tripeptide permease